MVLDVILSVITLLVLAGTVIVIIFDDGDVGRKVSWLLIIAIIPFIGFILYMLFGLNPKYHLFFDRRRKRFRAMLEEQHLPPPPGMDEAAMQGIEPQYRTLAKLLSRNPFAAPSTGNDIEIITNGDRKYHLLLSDLEAARESIHIEYFHFGNDSGSRDIRDMLIRKAREGVKVRFLNENIGNFPIRRRYYDSMREAGVEVVRFTAIRRHLVELITRLNYRNHRKIVVIDGNIGYTGGMNINDKYFLRWRDTHIRVTGPSVAGLQYMFLDSWVIAGGTVDKPLSELMCPDSRPAPTEGASYPLLRGKTMQVVPDAPYSFPVLQKSYEWAFLNAKEYIYVQTPYFAPSEEMLQTMLAAARSGVDVRIMLPKDTDTPIMGPANRSYYKRCLEEGIRIYERSGKFIHSKTFVSDDYLSCIGTTNLDMRSFTINYEDNSYVYDRETALQCKEIFMEDMGLSTEVTMEDVKKWPWYTLLIQHLVGFLAPLL